VADRLESPEAAAPRGLADTRKMGRDASLAALGAAVADLLEPDTDALRLPAEQVAAVFLGLLFTRPREEPALGARELVDVFLHGALTRGQG
jgi:hypothetical protein